MDPATEVVFVDQHKQLHRVQAALAAATFVGIDAEWKPEERYPKAQLLQLAAWGPGDRTSANITVWVLDMAALDPQPLAKMLGAMFRQKSTVKVTFNAAADLRAIAKALGYFGPSTVARVEPLCEIGAVNKFLRIRQAPGIEAVGRSGLSNLVVAQLGKALDKRLQCSPWDVRPISPEQIRYAATDAAVLVELLDAYARQANPRDFCMRRYLQRQLERSVERMARRATATASASEGAGTASAGASRDDDLSAAVQGLEISSTPEGKEGGRGQDVAAEDTAAESETAAAAAVGSEVRERHEAEGPADAEAEVEAEQELDLEPLPASRYEGLSETEALALDVSRSWSYCLEMEGGKRVKVPQPEREQGAASGPAGRGVGGRGAAKHHLLGIGSYVHHLVNAREEEARGKVARERELEALESLPLLIPWEETGSAPKFVADSALEGLARQLRSCGIDASALTSAPSSSSSSSGAAPLHSSSGQGKAARTPTSSAQQMALRLEYYKRLTETAVAEGRVILTSDKNFCKRRYSKLVYYVRSVGKTEMLREVLQRFDIHLKSDQLLSRCNKCNAELIPTAFSASDLPPRAAATVSAAVLARPKVEFWVCGNESCQRAFYQGATFQRSIENLKERVNIGE